MRGPRSATGQVFYGLLDTADVPLDVLQVQPPSDNLAASDLKQRHPARDPTSGARRLQRDLQHVTP